MRHSGLVKLFVVLAAVAPVAAACGSDDDSTAATSSESVADSAAPSSAPVTDSAAPSSDPVSDSVSDSAAPSSSATTEGSEVVTPVECDSPGFSADAIKLGMLITETGPSAGGYAETRAGIDARFAYQNEELGGVGGRRIEYTALDDASDPTAAPLNARQLVESDEVFGVMIASAGGDGTAGQYLSDNGIPVTGFNGSSAWGQFENYFGAVASGGAAPVPTPVSTGADFLVEQGVENLGAVTYAFPAAVNAAEQYLTAFEAVTGNAGTLLGDAPPGNADWSVQAQQISEAGSDGLYLPMAFQDAANAFQAVLQAGVVLDATIFPGGYGPTALEQMGESLEGASFSISYLPLSEGTEGQQVMLGALEEYSDVAVVDGLVDDFVTIGWLIGEAFIEGLNVAGDCPTREAFITNLRQVTDYDANGMLDPAIDYSTALGTPFLLCTHFVTVENGEFVPEPEVTRCGEVIE